MYRIAKTFHFSASHSLPQMPDGHPCKRLHGHNYSVTLILASATLHRELQFVEDYGEMKKLFGTYLDEVLDHRHLNDVLRPADVPTTTAENLAAFLYGVARSQFGPLVEAVRVSETPSTWAEYRE